jgi:hypothetical protein
MMSEFKASFGSQFAPSASSPYGLQVFAPSYKLLVERPGCSVNSPLVLGKREIFHLRSPELYAADSHAALDLTTQFDQLERSMFATWWTQVSSES